ncbi:uncharacterized protein LOC133195255 [Saccostrea echinata]|uniref:uncharacterized protein LOC133195255 n=1 Tax=Saccostrea echinata TaxID=191078 RepID=UPI002A8131F2|nr:uncharacterized protein LOC133195255 [Saccostrea echinata]
MNITITSNLHITTTGNEEDLTPSLKCRLSVCQDKPWYLCGTFVLTMVNLAVGTAANCFLCFQIIRKRSYHTTTFACIFVLALSDISASISMMAASVDLNTKPISTVTFSEIFEIVDRNILLAMATTVIWSNENMVLFAIERYSLMKNPIKYARFQTPKRIFVKSFLCLFITGVFNICTLVILIQLICKEMNANCILPFFGALGIPFWVVTLILLIVIHRSKIKRLRATHLSTNVQIDRVTSRMTKSIYVILINYFIANGPSLVIDILKFLELFCTFSFKVDGPLLFNVTFFFSSIKVTANPFIYFFCSKVKCQRCCYFGNKPLASSAFS